MKINLEFLEKPLKNLTHRQIIGLFYILLILIVLQVLYALYCIAVDVISGDVFYSILDHLFNGFALVLSILFLSSVYKLKKEIKPEPA